MSDKPWQSVSAKLVEWEHLTRSSPGRVRKRLVEWVCRSPDTLSEARVEQTVQNYILILANFIVKSQFQF